VLLRGLIIGFSIAAPVGPIGVLCIRRTLADGRAVGFAAGLGAAIPAVIGYNYYVNRVKHWATEMEGFTLDLLNTLSRPAPKVGRPSKDGV